MKSLSQRQLQLGAVGAPALSFVSDGTTGIYSTATGVVDIAISGVRKWSLASTGLTLVNNAIGMTAAPASAALSVRGSGSQVHLANADSADGAFLLSAVGSGFNASYGTYFDGTAWKSSNTSASGLLNVSGSGLTLYNGAATTLGASTTLTTIFSVTAAGNAAAPTLSASGLTGATSASRYVGATASGAPASGTFVTGDWVIDRTGAIWVCTAGGSPGTWTGVGGLGSGTATATTRSITQASHGFVVGDVLYLAGTTYAKARADAATTAEVVGIVSSVTNANTFVLTGIGLVTGLSGLTAGAAYFLSATVAGLMTSVEPSVTGQISKPVLIADSTTSGYFIPYRGMQIGGSSGSSSTASGGALLAYHNETASHDYTVSGTTLADVDATNMAVTFTAPSSGAVIVTLQGNAYANGNFMEWGLREAAAIVAGPALVTSSSNLRATASLLVSGLTPGSVHTYKWAAAMGASTGHIYVGGNSGVNGSALMTVRDSAVGGGTSSASGVTQAIAQVAHGFVVGDVAYLNGATYAKAKADTATTAEAVGVVSAVGDANNFTLATAGRVTGLSGLTAGAVYFLSDATAGLLTLTEPTVYTHISKPMLVADSTTSGFVVNFRGSPVGSAAAIPRAMTAIGDGSGDYNKVASASFTDVGVDAFKILIPAVVGDLLVMKFECQWYINAGAGTTQIRIKFSVAGTTISDMPTNGLFKTAPDTNSQFDTFMWRYVVQAADIASGTVAVEPQFANNATNTTSIRNDGTNGKPVFVVENWRQ